MSYLMVVALLVCAASLQAQDGATGGEWRHYGGDLGATGYSTLDQINRDNVGDLEIAWRWKAANSGQRPSSSTL